MTTLPTKAVLAVIEAEMRRRQMTWKGLAAEVADRFGGSPGAGERTLYRHRHEPTITIAAADRYLTALDLHLVDVAGYTPPVGRRRSGWHPAGVYGYLTDTQLRACHQLYQQGHSIRRVAQQILPRTRYRTVDSAMMGLRAGWVRLGLPRRTLAEAQKAAWTTPGRKQCAAPTIHGHDAGRPCRRLAVDGSPLCTTHARSAATHG